MSKAITLLSGGQDSTTCLFWARAMFDEVIALGIYYGQRHKRELDSATHIAQLAGVEFRMIELSALGKFADSDLVRQDTEIQGSGGHVDEAMPEGLPTSFVPGRNLLFLSLAAAVAVKEGAKDIVTGVCQTDYSGYPDCRREFVDAFEQAAALAMPSSAGPIRVHTPLMHMTKAETVRLADRLSQNWSTTCWDALKHSVTCYEGHVPGCGKCPACELRAAGFAEAGEADPAMLDGEG